MSVLDDIPKIGEELDRARKDYARACQAQQDASVLVYEKFQEFIALCRQLNAQSEMLTHNLLDQSE